MEDLSEIKGGVETILTNFKELQDVESKIYAKVEKLSVGKVDDAKYNAL